MKTIEDLIPKLVEKTRQGALTWSKAETTDNFKATLKNYLAQVWEWTDQEDGSEGISFSVKPIRNPENFDTIYYDKYSSKYNRLKELFDVARRSALNLDKMVDDIEAELDDL